MGSLIGKSLGRYTILEEIGEGGMAVVYRANDSRLDRDVAIKVIRKGAFPADHMDRILKRFEREAKALARLSHPNIMKVHDYGEHEGSPFLVMEYLPGGNLKKKIIGKPWPWQGAIQLLLPIAEALDYAHSQNMIHRDVKPSNILLTQRGQPMLTDFGIAKMLEVEEGQTLTGTGMGVGTPEYMSPEQWKGQASPRSDIYSLGVILYELLAGRKPYIADTPADLLLKQATEPLPRLNAFAKGLPPNLEKILFKALERKPEDRFGNMSEFVFVLDTLIKGSPVSTSKRQLEDSQATFDQFENQKSDANKTKNNFFILSILTSIAWVIGYEFWGYFFYPIWDFFYKTIGIGTIYVATITTSAIMGLIGGSGVGVGLFKATFLTKKNDIFVIACIWGLSTALGSFTGTMIFNELDVPVWVAGIPDGLINGIFGGFLTGCMVNKSHKLYRDSRVYLTINWACIWAIAISIFNEYQHVFPVRITAIAISGFIGGLLSLKILRSICKTGN